MKTAMQELIEWTNQYEGQMISADQVVLKAHKLIEKERNQMLDAIMFHNTDPYSDLKIYAEEYLNRKYNQNK